MTVTVHGRPSAVLLAVEDLDALEETIAVLSDTGTLRQLAASDAELARGEGETKKRWLPRCAAGGHRVSNERYQLVISPTARRQLTEILPEAVALAAHELSVGHLLEKPHPVGKQLTPPLADRHSARRGTYRVIYRIDDRHNQVTVVAVVHRSDACRI